MKRSPAAAALGLAAACLGAPAASGIWTLPPGVPPPPVTDTSALTPARIELGRRLFYDPRLSVNGNSACGACHRQEFAFTDGRARAAGATGDLHARGSMSLVNVAYRSALTRATPPIGSLEEQALVPMFSEHPVELGLKGHEARVFAALAVDPMYARLFREAFPSHEPRVTSKTIAAAIAAFERTIVSFRSPYDRYRFEGVASAIEPSARRGAALFEGKAGCARCHEGINFDGSANGSRAPTLRNIGVTSPYMLDGRAPTLDAVLDGHGAGAALDSSERGDLLAFLDSLTDLDALVDTRWRDPWRTQW